jgi:hypothetical protein
MVRIAIGVCLTMALVSANSPLRAPDDPIASAKSEIHDSATDPVPTPASYFSKGLFFVYQEFIGPTKGSRCPMTPSCSEYGRLAVKRYGLGTGILMTGDRIHRCGHDQYLYNKAITRDGVYNEDLPRR